MIDVLIIHARQSAGDDAVQHMTAKPTMTRRNSWSVTWDSQTDTARERAFDLRLETAEKSVQGLLEMKDHCRGSNDLDVRLESGVRAQRRLRGRRELPPWRQPRGKSEVNLPQMPPDSGGICMGVD